MADSRNFAALAWVMGEINETLQEAKDTLQAYNAAPHDTALLRFCLTLIHQVLGSLRMVEFHGAALIAEELEHLVQALLQDHVTNAQEAQEVLMQGLLQLPVYLNHVQNQKDDHPGVALPLLNDIRAVCKHALLSETGLFSPNLSRAHAGEGERHSIFEDRSKLVASLKKLREMHQYAAASLLKDLHVEENLEYLEKVYTRLELISRGTAFFGLWQAATGLAEGLRAQKIPLCAAVRSIIRRLARELHQLEDNAPAAFNAPPKDGLLKNILYYVARCEQPGPLVRALHQKYQLDKALHDGALNGLGSQNALLSAPDPDAIRAVVSALHDELNTVKHILDLAQQGQASADDLQEILPLFKRVADTLAVLGLPELRQFAKAQHDHLAQFSQQGTWTPTEFADLVSRIAQLDLRLEAVARQAGRSQNLNTLDEHQTELDSAKDSVIRESRLGLEQCKDALLAFYQAQGDAHLISEVPNLMGHIRGGLSMIGQTRAANIISAAQTFIEHQYLGDNAPSAITTGLNALANVIEGVDYYLERISGVHTPAEVNSFLQLAEDSLNQLHSPSSADASAPIDIPVLTEAVALTEPPTPSAPTAAEAPQAEDALIDDDIIEVFIEEANEVMGTLEDSFPKWTANLNNTEALSTLRRAFHTLKGSGRMVEAHEVGELAWSVENLLNRLLDRSITASAAQVDYIKQVLAFMPSLIYAFAQRKPNRNAGLTQQLINQGQTFGRGELPEEYATFVAPDDNEDAPSQPLEDDDRALWQIFATEAQGHLATLDAFIAQMDEDAPLYSTPSADVQRALHTLKGSAHMASLTPIALLATPLEGYVKELRAYQLPLNASSLQLLKDGSALLQQSVQALEQGQVLTHPESEAFIQRTQQLQSDILEQLARNKDPASAPTVNPNLLSRIMTDDMQHLLNADTLIAAWHTNPNARTGVAPLVSELEQLEQGATEAGLPLVARLGAHLALLHELALAQDSTPPEAYFTQVPAGHEHLLGQLDALAAGLNLQPPSAELQQHLDQLAHSLRTQLEASHLPEEDLAEDILELQDVAASDTFASEALLNQPIVPLLDEPILLLDDTSEAVPGLGEPSQMADSITLGNLDLGEHSSDQLAEREAEEADPEILEIFLEEADELLETLDEAVNSWEANAEHPTAGDAMKRALHTLKGGARLSGQMAIGELTHTYETYLTTVAGPKADPAFIPTLLNYQDQLLRALRKARARHDGLPYYEEPSLQPPVLLDSIQLPDTPSDAPSQLPALAEAPAALPLEETTHQALSDFGSRKAGGQEMVKVNAELLEELVNLAGETAISRGRIEQQVKGLGSAIFEIDVTLRRLQEQLRRLDQETEAQIIFRQEQLATHEDFDPLEMDRYSQLQQLTRSLAESASDLVDLKRTLSDKVKDTEAILLQQSRVNSSLQEGLMRSRMVPFARLVPRLRRIVRQVGSELGKHVNFELDNIEGEMDRTVLERMVAPLEHMLRNAVDHGIEPPQERLSQGKAEAGRIVISLAREGSDILLRLADDGRGISLDKVRNKAIERGLMAADSQLSDHEVMQFILQAGFSTAENITQISGRGVGMDVVAAEIKQLGGSMTIESRPGIGSQFTVRLPFTVSVNRALMVTLGQDTFAVPLNAIEGIVRVSPFELEHYYQDPNARFEYAGENYQVRYLGTMLYEGAQPTLEGKLVPLPLPVILVRSAQHTMALQVDGLSGSREIVVKSLGKQFAAVQGLSGATVMGDGSVVVILDVHALVRKAIALTSPTPLTFERQKALAPVRSIKTIMVVDDSVTVRKVTTRFLEREGFQVITAKDGLDALRVLQDAQPDLMLLDIEMPRMDGFEVAKNLRTSNRWKNLPIIMITSRTGDKHREHAFSVGVNHYLGKPYQEDLLLGLINQTLQPTGT